MIRRCRGFSPPPALVTPASTIGCRWTVGSAERCAPAPAAVLAHPARTPRPTDNAATAMRVAGRKRSTGRGEDAPAPGVGGEHRAAAAHGRRSGWRPGEPRPTIATDGSGRQRDAIDTYTPRLAPGRRAHRARRLLVRLLADRGSRTGGTTERSGAARRRPLGGEVRGLRPGAVRPGVELCQQRRRLHRPVRAAGGRRLALYRRRPSRVGAGLCAFGPTAAGSEGVFTLHGDGRFEVVLTNPSAELRLTGRNRDGRVDGTWTLTATGGCRCQASGALF